MSPTSKLNGKQGLTVLQQRFVEEYLIDRNAAAAAKRAGSSANARNLKVVGHNILKVPAVRAAVNAGLKAMADKTQVTAERVVQEFARLAFANIMDFVEHDADGLPVMEKGKFVLDFSKITPDQAAAIGKLKDDGTIELLDKKGALDSLGRHLGLFKDNIAISGETKTELKVRFV